MKKIISLLLCILTASFYGCSNEVVENEKTTVISTVFAPYDFTKQISEDLVNSELLMPPGTESHTYEPTPKDIIRLQQCDLFIYIGGESESWIDSVLKSLENPPRTLRLMDVVELQHEEVLEGMEDHEHSDDCDHDEDHEHGDDCNHDHDDEAYDEHIWTSPVNAIKITQSIRDALCEIDSSNSEKYKTAAENYIGELTLLHNDFKEYFDVNNEKPLIFGDRFPLLYFAREYNLVCYAAFPGCSAQTEPSASTVSFLIDKVRDENISTIYYIEFSTHLIANAIAEATGADTALFHTCHNVSGEEIKNGATYINLMRSNLETLENS